MSKSSLAFLTYEPTTVDPTGYKLADDPWWQPSSSFFQLSSSKLARSAALRTFYKSLAIGLVGPADAPLLVAPRDTFFQPPVGLNIYHQGNPLVAAFQISSDTMYPLVATIDPDVYLPMVPNAVQLVLLALHHLDEQNTTRAQAHARFAARLRQILNTPRRDLLRYTTPCLQFQTHGSTSKLPDIFQVDE